MGNKMPCKIRPLPASLASICCFLLSTLPWSHTYLGFSHVPHFLLQQGSTDVLSFSSPNSYIDFSLLLSPLSQSHTSYFLFITDFCLNSFCQSDLLPYLTTYTQSFFKFWGKKIYHLSHYNFVFNVCILRECVCFFHPCVPSNSLVPEN